MEWYYAEAGQRAGPIPEAEFRALETAGKLGPDDLVWTAGMAAWQPLASVQSLYFPAAVPAGPICTECRREFPPQDLLAFESAHICGACKDIFFQRLRERGAAAVVRRFQRFGGFWIRLLARIIDFTILWGFFIVLMFVWEAAMQRVIFNPARVNSYDLIALWGGLALIYFISTTATIVYESWFVWRRGATPGKLAVGVRVVRANGEALSVKRSVGRSFAYLLTGTLPLAIGFLMAGLDEEKRALHDRICDTRVVYRS